MEFIISLIIFIIFSILGGLVARKLPKIEINIPEPIFMFIGWATMCSSFYYYDDRILQIVISFVLGLVLTYLLENKSDD